MAKQSNQAEVFEAALKAHVSDFPNSIVASLMLHFPSEVVINIVRVYSGRTLTIPGIKTVWRSYRNRIIRDRLDLENTSATRQKLATFFTISVNHVSDIYRKEIKNRRIGGPTLRAVTKRVYADELGKVLEDARKILFDKRKTRKGGDSG